MEDVEGITFEEQFDAAAFYGDPVVSAHVVAQLIRMVSEEKTCSLLARELRLNSAGQCTFHNFSFAQSVAHHFVANSTSRPYRYGFAILCGYPLTST
jgi:hypothetical protein